MNLSHTLLTSPPPACSTVLGACQRVTAPGQSTPSSTRSTTYRSGHGLGCPKQHHRRVHHSLFPTLPRGGPIKGLRVVRKQQVSLTTQMGCGTTIELTKIVNFWSSTEGFALNTPIAEAASKFFSCLKIMIVLYNKK